MTSDRSPTVTARQPVNENAAIGTIVGVTASAADVDATNNTITYTLQDNDGGRFAIDSSGVVTVAGAIDREADGASRNITMRATSADGSFTDQVMTININDVDEFDVGTVTDADAVDQRVDENATVARSSGSLRRPADADATTNTITYTLQDNDGGRFAIDGNHRHRDGGRPRSIEKPTDRPATSPFVRPRPTVRSPTRPSRLTSTISTSLMSAR